MNALNKSIYTISVKMIYNWMTFGENNDPFSDVIVSLPSQPSERRS